jgi:hypothetical protein
MDREAIVKRTAAQAWECAEERVLTTDFSSFYPWVCQYRIYLVAGPENQTAFVAVAPQGPTITFFHNPDQLVANVQELNRLLRTEGAALPGVLAPLPFAKSLRAFLLGTQGFVGSADFWEEQALGLNDWVGTLPLEQTLVLFKKYCADPVVERQKESWTLCFFWFNNEGGVERWTVSGGATQVREAGFQMVVPAGTLEFPYM